MDSFFAGSCCGCSRRCFRVRFGADLSHGLASDLNKNKKSSRGCLKCESQAFETAPSCFAHIVWRPRSWYFHLPIALKQNRKRKNSASVWMRKKQKFQIRNIWYRNCNFRALSRHCTLNDMAPILFFADAPQNQRRKKHREFRKEHPIIPIGAHDSMEPKQHHQSHQECQNCRKN